MNETKEIVCEKCGAKMKRIEVFGKTTLLQCTNTECNHKDFLSSLEEKPSDENILEESRD